MAMSYFRGYLFPFHPEAEPSDTGATVTILPSNPAASNLSADSSCHGQADVARIGLLTTTEFLISPGSNDLRMRDEIIARAIKPKTVSLPDGWSNTWKEWLYVSSLEGPFDQSEIQIYLELKYHLRFADVEMLMFKPETGDMVFRYQQQYCRYMVHDAVLFVYPDSYDSVDLFLEQWDDIDGEEEEVEEKGTDEQCMDIIFEEACKARVISSKTLERDVQRNALLETLFDF
ncbi:hypothetical protein C8J56DRAFT_937802 [Mycena floridula]|nr:hypothetical protein C8J56DRAFT_937802 [Mycena floridula]